MTCLVGMTDHGAIYLIVCFPARHIAWPSWLQLLSLIRYISLLLAFEELLRAA